MKFFEVFSRTNEDVGNTSYSNVTKGNGTNMKQVSTPAPLIDNKTSSTNLELTTAQPNLSTSSSVLTELRNMASMPHFCNQTSCLEWSTEKLLKARLCCLNFLNADEEASSGDTGTNSTDSTSLVHPVNSVGGFGCQLYARWRCTQILPIIKCCLRKVLNEYFDYTIKKREQQQRIEFGSLPPGTTTPLVRQPH